MKFTTIPAIAALLATLPAQEAIHPTWYQAQNHDSGYRDNATAAVAVVAAQDVTFAGAHWLQIHFRDTNLPEGSRLRLASPLWPDAAQWFDAHSLRDYQGWSCQFLGPTVRVELHAGPHTAGNRFLVDQQKALQVGSIAEIDSICGPTDDRVLSSDPRACRINSSCTAWLFSPYAVGTAGHCMSSTSGQILHFNVPLSTTSGSTRPAHPNDQYALESFLQRLNGGVGQDWSASIAVRNSNTGLFPGQAQGSWYTIVPASPTISGDIRITGYGTGNGTSGSPTWNQVQKTHVGPRISTTTANALRYTTDTTGGNSGSPVIHEQTGNVIGVHTHGGCSTSGGGNSGTNAARTDWTAARTTVLNWQTVGETSTFGTGCGGASGVPSLSLTGIPEIGRTVTVQVGGLHPTAATFGAFLIGFSNASWNGNPLPLSLAGFGMTGCTLHVRPDITNSTAIFFGTAVMPVAIPNTTAYVGTNVYFQHLALDSTATNSVGAVASNAGRLFVGN